MRGHVLLKGSKRPFERAEPFERKPKYLLSLQEIDNKNEFSSRFVLEPFLGGGSGDANVGDENDKVKIMPRNQKARRRKTAKKNMKVNRT